MLQKLYLVCLTTDEGDTHTHALLELKPNLARQLLEYRPVFNYVKDHDDTLYCLEFFDSTVCYGEGFHNIADIYDPAKEKCWLSASVNPGLRFTHDTDVATVKVTDRGVLWSASPKHGEGYFETPEITWEQLEAIVFSGKDPFDPAPMPKEEPANG